MEEKAIELCLLLFPLVFLVFHDKGHECCFLPRLECSNPSCFLRMHMREVGEVLFQFVFGNPNSGMHGMGNYTVILNSIPDVGKKKKAIVVDQSLLGDCCLQKKSWN